MKLGKNYLAPIEDYTTLPFRLLAQKHGAKATVAPLISATSFSKNKEYEKYVKKFVLHYKEKFLGVQLVGSNSADFGIAAKKIEREFNYVKWIDINAGCPSGKTVGSNCGAALLSHPQKIAEIVHNAKKSGLPVSVKMRLAENMKKTLVFVNAIQQADFIVVHGRTKNQGYSGNADWNAIKDIYSFSKIPVVGNGDVKTLAQGEQLVHSGFCSSFMVGRTALSNPLLFENKKTETKEDKKNLFYEYMKIAEKCDLISLPDIKRMAFEFFRGAENSAPFRNAVARSKLIEEIMERVKEF